MLWTLDDKELQNKVLHDHGGLFWCPENFWIRMMFASEIERVVSMYQMEHAKHKISEKLYRQLMDLEFLRRSMDMYWAENSGNIEEERVKQWFETMSFSHLCIILEDSKEADWRENLRYYFALYETIEELLQELNIPIGTSYLT
jgi:hypothetical protein